MTVDEMRAVILLRRSGVVAELAALYAVDAPVSRCDGLYRRLTFPLANISGQPHGRYLPTPVASPAASVEAVQGEPR